MEVVNEFLKYMKRNDYLWLPLTMVLVTAIAIVLMNIIMIPSYIHSSRENELTKQTILIAKQQSLANTIFNTATSLCRDYNTINNVNECVASVAKIVNKETAFVK